MSGSLASHCGLILIDTDNLTEAFNNALRSRYLRLRQDTSVFEFVQILLNILFPEQESDYIVAVAQQTGAYRRPRYNMPDFLKDRPHSVQAACLANISNAKEFVLADVTTQGAGKFIVTNNQGTNSKDYFVDIPGGTCSCSYFSKSNVPCKHIFAIFNLFSLEWTWNDLPKHLTESLYLTLETSVISEVDSKSTGNTSENDDGLIDINQEDDESDQFQQKPDQPPIPITSAHKLRCLQKKAHEMLTKCRDICYCCTDTKVLEETLSSAEMIYRQIVLSANPKNVEEELPSFPQLAKSSVNESNKKSKRVCRSTLNDGCPPPKRFKASCDPLYCASSKGPGRPKNIRPRREKPALPRQVSDTTRKLSLSLKKRHTPSRNDNKENQGANVISSASQGTKRIINKPLPSGSLAENHQSQTMIVRKKRRGCKCAGCSIPDCGQCKFCRDMVKFGGPGKKKQHCSKRKCVSQDQPLQSQPKVEDNGDSQEKSACQTVTEDSVDNLLLVAEFLSQSGRFIRKVAPDGNCFFRAVSYHLLGTESAHYSVRSLLLRFESFNRELFEKRLIPPINKSSIDEHIQHLSQSNEWCTQVELMALATYYQVPLYCCVSSINGRSYHWEVTNPITTPESLRYFEVAESDPLAAVHRPSSHFEFLYWEHLHFDIILLKDSNLPSSTFPHIPSVHTYLSVE